MTLSISIFYLSKLNWLLLWGCYKKSYLYPFWSASSQQRTVMDHPGNTLWTMSQFGKRLLDFWRSTHMGICMKLEMERQPWNFCMPTGTVIRWDSLKASSSKNNSSNLSLSFGNTSKCKFNKLFLKKFLNFCSQESLISP